MNIGTVYKHTIKVECPSQSAPICDLTGGIHWGIMFRELRAVQRGKARRLEGEGKPVCVKIPQVRLGAEVSRACMLDSDDGRHQTHHHILLYRSVQRPSGLTTPVSRQARHVGRSPSQGGIQSRATLQRAHTQPTTHPRTTTVNHGGQQGVWSPRIKDFW